MPHPSRLTQLAAAVVLLCGFFAPRAALAQLRTLPTRMTAATPPDTSRIQAYVAAQKEALESDDPLKVRAARNALVQPFSDRGITALFRIEYGKPLLALIDRMIKSGDDLHAS